MSGSACERVAVVTASARSLPSLRVARKELNSRARTMTRAEEFRQNADECRQQAERAHNPLDKERWLKIAQTWLKMAQEVDVGGGSS